MFALLSHPSAQNLLRKRTIAQADHTKPILEVYQELAEEPLRTPGHHLELLSAVEHAPHVDFDLFDGFPSWVPRWGFGGQSTILGEPEFSHFRTAISKGPKITISGSGRVMRIGGMLLEHVVRHSELIDIKDLLNPRRVLINKLRESYGSTNFSDTYITGELLIEAF